MTVPETLRAMAAKVRRGWCQRAAFTLEGVCAVGALNFMKSRDGRVDWQSVIVALVAVLGHSCVSPEDAWLHVIKWNDAPGQTAENVALAMELAASNVEAEQQIALAALVEEAQADGLYTA